jgi:hypothetical protein
LRSSMVAKAAMESACCRSCSLAVCNCEASRSARMAIRVKTITKINAGNIELAASKPEMEPASPTMLAAVSPMMAPMVTVAPRVFRNNKACEINGSPQIHVLPVSRPAMKIVASNRSCTAK